MTKPWFKFLWHYIPYPATWQGYLIAIAYLLMAFTYAARHESGEAYLDSIWSSIFPVAVLTFIYVILARQTSETEISTKGKSSPELLSKEKEVVEVMSVIAATNNLPSLVSPQESSVEKIIAEEKKEEEITQSLGKVEESFNKDEHVISIKNLTKSFKDLKVLEGINLSVEKGTMLALLGPNGAGKTTIVRILSTLLKPDSGEVKVAGANVEEDPNIVRQNIGLTGQYAAVDEYLTGRENLNMMGALYHLSKKDALRRTDELLEEFDLSLAADRPVKTYSGGMRRRLDLAASLISTPPILFLDEPTTGLDPRSRLKIWEIVRKLLKSGITILLTTQYLEEADRLANKIAVLHKGKIIALGTSDELKKKVGNERLDVVLSNYDDYKLAKVALGDLVSFSNEDERRISITTGSEANHIKRVLDTLEKESIHLESFSLHKPTLDDVFLELTGSATEEVITE